ncbi:MAG TPA: CAP domain-containing protein [Mycobacteriales bacterium]|nr:CAP domain-containing protein [Mycobacteriales bacterium]
MQRKVRSLFGATAVALTAATVALAAPASAATRTPSVATLVARCTTLHALPGTTPRAAMFAQLQCIRRTAGLPAFRASTPIADVARRWSAQMAGADGLEHNPDLSTQLAAVDPRWSEAGEVIGYGGAGTGQVSRLVAAWLRSPHHRALLLDPHLRVIGIGLATGHGQLWGTVDLADA